MFLLDSSKPSIFSCFSTIVERGERAASELDASAKREARGGRGGGGERKKVRFLNYRTKALLTIQIRGINYNNARTTYNTIRSVLTLLGFKVAHNSLVRIRHACFRCSIAAIPIIFRKNLLVQTCTSFTNEQIDVIVTSKIVAMATSYEVKDTLFWTF